MTGTLKSCASSCCSSRSWPWMPCRAPGSCCPRSLSSCAARMASTPARCCCSASDPRPDPDKLRAVLLGDDPDHPPEWVQADAVPALMQLLQAEDRQVRMVLVEVLGRIKDMRAT